MIVAEYNVATDECYFDQHVPISNLSKEEFMEAFELAMAAYEPGKTETFEIQGQTFQYDWFIYWVKEQTTKRRFNETYHYVAPRLFTLDEWVESSKNDGLRLQDKRDEHKHVVAENFILRNLQSTKI